MNCITVNISQMHSFMVPIKDAVEMLSSRTSSVEREERINCSIHFTMLLSSTSVSCHHMFLLKIFYNLQCVFFLFYVTIVFEGLQKAKLL